MVYLHWQYVYLVSCHMCMQIHSITHVCLVKSCSTSERSRLGGNGTLHYNNILVRSCLKSCLAAHHRRPARFIGKISFIGVILESKLKECLVNRYIEYSLDIGRQLWLPDFCSSINSSRYRILLRIVWIHELSQAIYSQAFYLKKITSSTKWNWKAIDIFDNSATLF